jgi:hypothetical protein
MVLGSTQPVRCAVLPGAALPFYRCGQPAKQHGLRIPPFNLETAFSILIPLVSAFFPDITQQTHSLRASGVMSVHTASADLTDLIAFLRSFGVVCAGPAMLLLITSVYDAPYYTDLT